MPGTQTQQERSTTYSSLVDTRCCKMPAFWIASHINACCVTNYAFFRASWCFISNSMTTSSTIPCGVCADFNNSTIHVLSVAQILILNPLYVQHC